MSLRVSWSRAAPVAVSLTMLVGGLGLAGATSAAAYDDRCLTTPVVAHRGVTYDGVVENTFKSMQAAIDRGVGFEMDVRTLADGRLVVMHDARLDRTTSGVGEVAATTSAELDAMLTEDGQRVPYVNAALRLVRDNPATRVVLDLKALSPAGLKRLATKIGRYRIANRVSAISFRDDLIRGFRARNPGVATFRILSYLPTPEQAATYGGVSVWGHLVTDEWTASMRKAKVPFNIRISDDPAMWDVAVAAGSGWVMTDDVDGFAAYCQASTTRAAG